MKIVRLFQVQFSVGHSTDICPLVMRVLFRWASRSAGIHVVSPLRTVACTTRHTLGVSFWDLTGCLLEHAPMYPQGGNLTQSSLSIVGLTDSNFRNLRVGGRVLMKLLTAFAAVSTTNFMGCCCCRSFVSGSVITPSVSPPNIRMCEDRQALSSPVFSRT